MVNCKWLTVFRTTKCMYDYLLRRLEKTIHSKLVTKVEGSEKLWFSQTHHVQVFVYIYSKQTYEAPKQPLIHPCSPTVLQRMLAGIRLVVAKRKEVLFVNWNFVCVEAFRAIGVVRVHLIGKMINFISFHNSVGKSSIRG